MAKLLNVYLLLDTSGSMNGDPITAVNVGLDSMLKTLRKDPYCLDVVQLSIHTFDAQVKEVLPLTPLAQVQLPHITCPPSGPTFLGEALEALLPKVQQDKKTAGLAPLLMIMTDGSPSDLQVYEEAIPKIKQVGFKDIIGFAVGPKAKPEFLQQLTGNVTRLETADSASFLKLFDQASRSVNDSVALAPLPAPPPALTVPTITAPTLSVPNLPNLPPPPESSIVF
jgi:uncharacterized protein YegL